ncbi:hypothetical protein CCC_03118 [Paramagnetospirillum magnetotacticum MS-1]|uniref:Uncharacterized protein n=2 Tax=Paramagnetospirillum magnetotacticum TaxID=188 RepID=A0A0C2Z0T7_PARME|nr:hypothetical protein CCC_03118 [Paramagnetospirillum magnetotacticum MS-1]
MFFIGAALLILALRWSLDLVQLGGASAAFIFLSYLTDALVFAVIWTAVTQTDGEAGLLDGWRLLAGRRLKVIKAGIWGLPSAAVSYLLLSLGATLFQAVSVALGARIGGWLMLGWIFMVGWLCCALLFVALFACIETARGEDGLWKAGIKGMRGAYLGWRPLLAIWTAFVCAATLCAALGAGVLGHISMTTLDDAGREVLAYWINWPALFLAVMALLALLVPIGTDVLVSDRSNAGGETELAAFGEAVAVRLGQGLKALAAAVILSGLLVINVGIASSLTAALALWLTGRALAASAPAWGKAEAGPWARWKWLVFPGLPLLLLWLGATQIS